MYVCVYIYIYIYISKHVNILIAVRRSGRAGERRGEDTAACSRFEAR